MASIYKRREWRPIPEGAEVVTYRGRRYAKWMNAKTDTMQRAQLNEEGTRVIREAEFYTIEYYDHDGQRVRKGTRCADKDAAQQLANELETRAMMRREGLIDPAVERIATEGRRSLQEHVADFRATMEAAGRDAKHVETTMGYIGRVIDIAHWQTAGDIAADAVNTYAADLLVEGKSSRTVQAVLTGIKSFTKWLTRHGKLPADPLAGITKPSPKTDRRHERRMLLPEEWDWLRTTTEAGPHRYNMTGHERMLAYAVAIQTGLRASELGSLTRGRLFLDQDPPFVTCKAGNTKNKQDARLYLHRDVADMLAAHVLTKAPGAPVFAMPHIANVARMFKVDLADARRVWLNAARGPEDRMQREQSDFLAERNHDGEVADFHCLRHSCGAWLAMAGNHPKTVQTIMRHSSIVLTMDTYGHLFPGQEADAVARMPGMFGSGPEALQATGTDGEPIPDGRKCGGSNPAKRVKTGPDEGEEAPTRNNDADCRKVLVLNTLGNNRRDVSKAGPLGFEPRLTDPESGNPCEIPEENGAFCKMGAFAVAVETKVCSHAPDLQTVIDAWDALPDAIRAGILAMVRSTHGT